MEGSRMIQNILLGAGGGTRSGGEKLFWLYENKPIIYHSVANSLRADLPTILVLGYRHAEILSLIEDLTEDPLLTVVINDHWRAGQGSSTKVGARRLDRGKRFFISLGDMPLITPEHYHFLEQFSETVVRPTVHGKVGHPVLHDPFLLDEILRQPDSFTMRELLSAYEVKKIAVDDPAYIRDIDTLQEYQELLGNHYV
jgi:molybdenum cofactor cytidylyltransferase